jgi:hypothetical protein
MTRLRRSTPGIAFAAAPAGRFQTGSKIPGAEPKAAKEKRQTFDIVAAGKRVEATAQRRRALGVAGGAALLAFAFVPRGFVGAVLAVVGAALVVRGVTGQSLGETAKRIARRLGSARERDRRDAVDQASFESFPASDPPAHSPSKA